MSMPPNGLQLESPLLRYPAPVSVQYERGDRNNGWNRSIRLKEEIHGANFSFPGSDGRAGLSLRHPGISRSTTGRGVDGTEQTAVARARGAGTRPGQNDPYPRSDRGRPATHKAAAEDRSRGKGRGALQGSHPAWK